MYASESAADVLHDAAPESAPAVYAAQPAGDVMHNTAEPVPSGVPTKSVPTGVPTES